jgi:hypothetical protein
VTAAEARVAMRLEVCGPFCCCISNVCMRSIVALSCCHPAIPIPRVLHCYQKLKSPSRLPLYVCCQNLLESPLWNADCQELHQRFSGASTLKRHGSFSKDTARTPWRLIVDKALDWPGPWKKCGALPPRELRPLGCPPDPGPPARPALLSLRISDSISFRGRCF